MTNMPTKSKPVKTNDPYEPLIESASTDEAPFNAEDTIIFKRSHFFTALSVLTFAIGVALGYLIWGANIFSAQQADAQATNPPSAANNAPPQITRYPVDDAGFPSIGPENAPIVIVEFSDFQCPYCKQWQQTVYQPLLDAYPGQIRIVYRHLPLTSIHPDAQAAAEASMCANEQNKFWEFHDKLFGGSSLSVNVYSQYASELGLDLNKFEACVKNRTYQQAVQTDSDFALNLGISSTPTFFINGLAVVGAQPLGVFQQVIDKELAGEFPK